MEDLAFIAQVIGCCRAYIPTHIQPEELISAGYLGLCEARKRHDPKQGAQFKTYAAIRIRGAVLDELRKLSFFPARSAIHRVAVEVETLEVIPDKQFTPAEACELKDFWASVLNRLIASHRRVLVLHFMEGLALTEIALRLQVTPARISQLKKSALSAARDQAAISSGPLDPNYIRSA